MWTTSARIRATVAGMNNRASLLGKLLKAKRKKKLGYKRMSEQMRTPTNRHHGNLTNWVF
jgi:hypothetical protein